MSEETQTEETPSVESVLSEMRGIVTDMAKEIGTLKADKELAEDAGKRSREPVVTMDDTTGDTNDRERVAAGDGARTSFVQDAEYSLLPEWQRKYRTPEYDRQFLKYLMALESGDNEQIREVAAWNAELDPGWVPMMREHTGREAATRDQLIRQVSVGADASLVPTPTAAVIWQLKVNQQAIGPRATNWPTPNTSIIIPTETAHAAPAAVLESGTIVTSSPTYDPRTLTKQKSGHISLATRELIDDSPLGVANNIINSGARQLALVADRQDWNDGDGTPPNQTEAILQAAINDLTITPAVTLAMVTALVYSIPSVYRAGGVFYCEATVLAILAALVDGNGRNVFINANDANSILSGSQPGAPGAGTLLGFPVVEVPVPIDGTSGAGAGTAATNSTLVFCDPKEYQITESPNIRVEMSTEFAFAADQIAWKMVQRRDGVVGQTIAFGSIDGVTS